MALFQSKTTLILQNGSNPILIGTIYLNQKKEVRRVVQQVAMPLLLCNWMEVRKLFLEYLYDSPTCQYTPVNTIFARDEYQSDVGNLPHIHMMISITIGLLNKDQQRKVDDLIR